MSNPPDMISENFQLEMFPDFETRPYHPPVLVSACLLGVSCRWHGRRPARRSDLIDRLLKNFVPVPVCPEQLGGMPTPRSGEYLNGTGAEVLDGRLRVYSPKGEDLTDSYLRGAAETVRIAEIIGARKAYLKSGSPACDREGVAGEALSRAGIQVIRIP